MQHTFFSWSQAPHEQTTEIMLVMNDLQREQEREMTRVQVIRMKRVEAVVG